MKYTKHSIHVLLDIRHRALQQVREDGQKEYAHADDRPFRNFETLSEELGIPREQVAWVYFKKHLDGILAHIKGHRSQREHVRGRFKDAHLYLYLIEFMLDEDEDNANRAELDNMTSAAVQDLHISTIAERVHPGSPVPAYIRPMSAQEMMDRHSERDILSREDHIIPGGP